MTSPSPERFSFEEAQLSGRSKRGSVMFQALFFTPFALLMAAGVIFALAKVISGETGYIVMLTVAGILLVVMGYQAVHYMRDMSASPTSSEGEISKKWTKGNLFFFFMPSYYIAVKGKIYTITRNQYRGLLEEDMVRIQHYPHTLTVEFVERYDEAEKKFVPAEPDATGF
jgi:hypothetical protein